MKRLGMMMLVAAMLMGLGGLGGCVGIDGGETKNEVKPTTGQELIDLKAALDKGAITQQEYDSKKSAIFARRG